MQICNQIFFEEIERLLSEGGQAEFLLRGNSMRPLLRDGRDVVIVAPIQDEVKVGDVVLFRYRGRHILHRIIGRCGSRLTLAGDGNYRLLEEASVTDLAGRLIAVRRPSGRIIRCSDRSWRFWSRAWLSLPPFLRRVILGIARRLRLF